ncbi:hypothetical protein AB0O22_36375 [Streptomyces sp. NPDC091204]|uniref:hypothetical protein n=1 Tax=Streptomyces sp. NPDC091204 TaxID=3155299 RepID=UPI003422F868
MITDVLRSRRAQHQQWADTKRVVYARFLTSLAQAHSRIAMAAARAGTGPDRVQAVHDAFHSDPQHAEAKSVLRELAIAAPDHIYEAAVPVYEQLRAARDMLAANAVSFDAPEYQQVVQPFFTGLEALQRLMRDDLQPPASRRV